MFALRRVPALLAAASTSTPAPPAAAVRLSARSLSSQVPAARGGGGHGHGHGHGRPLDPAREYPNGFLFNEKPGPRAKWQDWEPAWYIGMIGGLVLFGVVTYYRPDTDPTVKARAIALERLREQNPDAVHEESEAAAPAHH
ncbi:hypothetical protein CAOG_03768 [Capsaspora owczarzaki ATCC 30864]|uniref:NADH dehydrogenase [ubiquinone] 1 beta subcomplex subunit 11, mitochondrial n=1 Tax=Capsaspora owczarzaki (strain ATCC 30864) TaxID=595528 RepID=A0A0D2WPX9_CAPO3|nr:hypothetical protein CAOG_03768 [Capsaspora owczarzaki ATCC 30864]KJE92878.1 hypothetical protein CAOG_003768 [Capsaspora owczarzaki ATCC 30864]|eukprot:XP_004363496.1 hypothetical protein CAOG_03768 [Capsaspora owczarzaki ATCC 30864]